MEIARAWVCQMVLRADPLTNRCNFWICPYQMWEPPSLPNAAAPREVIMMRLFPIPGVETVLLSGRGWPQNSLLPKHWEGAPICTSGAGTLGWKARREGWGRTPMSSRERRQSEVKGPVVFRKYRGKNNEKEGKIRRKRKDRRTRMGWGWRALGWAVPGLALVFL